VKQVLSFLTVRGFSGDVVIPVTEELKQFTPDAYATWSMADGSEVLTPIFLGTIRFPELDEDVAEMVGVTVTVLGDQALIGQSVLKHFTLTFDHGKQVILEP
jgi:predicted aspartyl protease